MGPTALFDKSFLQGITIDESVWFDHFFSVNVCPIFYAETQADLAKDCGDRLPGEYVRTIASKFPDSGAPNVHHVRICATNLLAEEVPFRPQIILPAGAEGRISGRRVDVLPESEEAKAFLRWTTGKFQDEEREYAKKWRELASVNISAQLIDRLTEEGFFQDRKMSSLTDVLAATDELLDRMGSIVQLVYALSLLQIFPQLHDRIIERFNAAGHPDIRTFAPYAAFCLRIELFFHIGVHKSKIGGGSKLDITYLFYLPFCHFFVSKDWVHKECVPLFLRPDQEFVYGSDMKASLAALDAHYSAMPGSDQKPIYEIAPRPPADGDGLVTRLWDRHWPKWRERREEKPYDPKAYEWLMNQGDAMDQILKDGIKTPVDSENMTEAICRPYTVRSKKGKWWQVPPEMARKKEDWEMDDEELLDELRNIKVPVHETVNAIFGGTQSLSQASTPIRNVIVALQSKNEFEQAMAGTYFRMHLLMESLTRLNNKRDFQVALQITRTMYELYIDLIELKNDPEKVQKFFAFGFVAKFGAAKKLVDELTKQGITDPGIAKHELAFVSDPKRRAKYDAELQKYWSGNGKPKHPMSWSDTPLPERAEAISKAEIIRYRMIYSLLCWFSHAGLVGLADLSADGIESSMGYAHAHTQEIFFDATNVIAGIFNVYEGNPKLKEPVDSYKMATAKILADFASRSLEAKNKANNEREN